MVNDVVADVYEFRSTDEMLAILREQERLYAQLETLAGKQRSLVEQDETEPLLRLLADRQRLATALSSIAARLEPARRNWSTYRAMLIPPERDEADQLLNIASQRLRRVIERDEEDARVLSARKRLMSASLESIHASQDAVCAYRPSGYAAAVRFDHTDGSEL